MQKKKKNKTKQSKTKQKNQTKQNKNKKKNSNLTPQIFANRNFTDNDDKYLVGKFLSKLVVEGNELTEKLGVLFETGKSFMLEVKLLEKDIWLNLSAGSMNESQAIIVATDIL
jgi:hypothetical protein